MGGALVGGLVGGPHEDVVVAIAVDVARPGDRVAKARGDDPVGEEQIGGGVGGGGTQVEVGAAGGALGGSTDHNVVVAVSVDIAGRGHRVAQGGGDRGGDGQIGGGVEGGVDLDGPDGVGVIDEDADKAFFDDEVRGEGDTLGVPGGEAVVLVLPAAGVAQQDEGAVGGEVGAADLDLQGQRPLALGALLQGPALAGAGCGVVDPLGDAAGVGVGQLGRAAAVGQALAVFGAAADLGGDGGHVLGAIGAPPTREAQRQRSGAAVDVQAGLVHLQGVAPAEVAGLEAPGAGGGEGAIGGLDPAQQGPAPGGCFGRIAAGRVCRLGGELAGAEAEEGEEGAHVGLTGMEGSGLLGGRRAIVAGYGSPFQLLSLCAFSPVDDGEGV